MAEALFWGIISASSLLLGGLLTFVIKVSSKPLGLIMGFGAGVLISAVAFEMAHKAIILSGRTGMAAIGLFAGCMTFYFGDRLIEKMGGHRRKAIHGAHGTQLAMPIILGIILDGIPESLVIGLSLIDSNVVGYSFLIAVFLSNLPETIAATAGLLAGGWRKRNIVALWLFVVLICGLASMAGFAFFDDASKPTQSFVQSFAGGAILVMLADTMMPEALSHGGKLAGVFTTIGFALAVAVSFLG